MNYITPEMNVRVDEGLEAEIDALSKAEFDLLLELIRTDNEIKTPIVLWKSDNPLEHNLIVDGHHRYKIAQMLGLAVPYEYREFDSLRAVKIWMIKNQKGRRNLTPLQWLRLASRLAKHYEIDLKQRELSGTALKPGEKPEEARRLAAKEMMVGERGINKYDVIEREEPELLDLIDAKILSLSAAYQIAEVVDPELKEDLKRSVDLTANARQNGSNLRAKFDELDNKQYVDIKAERISVTQEALVLDETPLTSEELALASQVYDERFSNTPNALLTGALLERAVAAEAERKACYLNSSRRLRNMLDLGQITLEDLLALVKGNVVISAVHDAPNLRRMAQELRIRAGEESAAKHEAGLKAREERLRKLSEEEALITQRNEARAHNARLLEQLARELANDTIYCPRHGPTCKLTCGMTFDEMALLARQNVIGLEPELVEEQVVVEGDVKMADMTTQKGEVVKTRHVRRPGDIGKLYVEET